MSTALSWPDGRRPVNWSSRSRNRWRSRCPRSRCPRLVMHFFVAGPEASIPRSIPTSRNVGGHRGRVRPEFAELGASRLHLRPARRRAAGAAVRSPADGVSAHRQWGGLQEQIEQIDRATTKCCATQARGHDPGIHLCRGNGPAAAFLGSAATSRSPMNCSTGSTPTVPAGIRQRARRRFRAAAPRAGGQVRRAVV